MTLVEHCWADPELFIMADEGLIEESENATFAICQLEKDSANPIMLPEQPWEGGDGNGPTGINQDPLDGTVLYDAQAKLFHCWYRTHNRLIRDVGGYSVGSLQPQGSQVCYATSADGIRWDKPVVGAVSYDNSFENNMVPVSVGPIQSNHLSGVTVNRVPEIDAALVGTVFSRFNDPIYPQGITILSSKDGMAWEPHFPPVLPIDGDAHCLVWDPRYQCYLCTTRSAAHTHEVGRARAKGCKLPQKRHIAIARSRDLVHWTPMMTVLEADDADPDNAQLYLMYVIPYGHGYVGLVQLFYMSEDMTYGPLDMHLAFGRDWMDWRRVGDRTPVIPRGPAGSWDQSHTTVYTNPPHPEGDRMRFWYGGKDTEHWQAGNAGMGTGTLRRDGFACWEAGQDGGVITTAPMKLNWSTSVFLNVEAPHGQVRAELIDADTREPIPGVSRDDCLPVTGDHTSVLVQHKEGRGTFIRHTGLVRWRFYLENAKLYAFRSPNLVFGETQDERFLWL
jgi:hypothetical protein